MSKYIMISVLLITFLCRLTTSSNILGIFPSAGYSQYLLAKPLMIALANKGHNVTVISAFETIGVKNLRNIKVHMPVDKKSIDSLYDLQELNIFQNLALFSKLTLGRTEQILSNDKVQQLLKSDESFDLVIVETFHNEGHLAFAKHFNAHLVLFSSIALSQWSSELIGNINLPSYLPTPFSISTTYMNFSERFLNTIALWYDKYLKIFYHYPAQQVLLNKYFPEQYDLEEVMYNANLILTCSHVSTSESVPLTSSVKEVGGLHITPKKLPKEFQSFLDSATDGAILFSMGSNLRSSSLPNETIQEIVSLIGTLKQNVIWKFEGDLADVPTNLMISKWIPQSDILAHPNVIMFISHCGMGGTTEAVYYGVPVVGIAIYADQFLNLKKLSSFGMAVEIPFKLFSGKSLGKAINIILQDPKYNENAKVRSRIMKDRVMEPLDEAVYWVEYVIRHNGASHLNSSVGSLTWYQLYLLDVIFVIFAVPYISFLLIRYTVKIHNLKHKN